MFQNELNKAERLKAEHSHTTRPRFNCNSGRLVAEWVGKTPAESKNIVKHRGMTARLTVLCRLAQAALGNCHNNLFLKEVMDLDWMN
jgi:hypothetical protein